MKKILVERTKLQQLYSKLISSLIFDFLSPDKFEYPLFLKKILLESTNYIYSKLISYFSNFYFERIRSIIKLMLIKKDVNKEMFLSFMEDFVHHDPYIIRVSVFFFLLNLKQPAVKLANYLM